MVDSSADITNCEKALSLLGCIIWLKDLVFFGSWNQIHITYGFRGFDLVEWYCIHICVKTVLL